MQRMVCGGNFPGSGIRIVMGSDIRQQRRFGGGAVGQDDGGRGKLQLHAATRVLCRLSSRPALLQFGEFLLDHLGGPRGRIDRETGAEVIQVRRAARRLEIANPIAETKPDELGRGWLWVADAEHRIVPEPQWRLVAGAVLMQRRDQAVELPPADLRHGVVGSGELVGHATRPRYAR